jgi:hypothetical protein
VRAYVDDVDRQAAAATVSLSHFVVGLQHLRIFSERPHSFSSIVTFAPPWRFVAEMPCFAGAAV